MAVQNQRWCEAEGTRTIRFMEMCSLVDLPPETSRDLM